MKKGINSLSSLIQRQNKIQCLEMDGSENVAADTENLTSSTMDSVPTRNMKDSESTANDSLPSSSSDANTAAAAVITQDDPISSTSEEVVAYKKVFVQQSDNSLDLQMDPETAQIAHQLDIASAKDGSQVKNFEDIASELENLLEESAGDYKFSGKISKSASSLDHRDINLDWDIDCEYSLTSKNSKLLDSVQKSKQSVCDNKSEIHLANVNIEVPSSSREVLESSERNNIVESISTHNNFVQGDTTRTCEPTNAEKITSKPKCQSALDNMEIVNSINIVCSKGLQSCKLIENKDVVVSTKYVESCNSPSFGAVNEIIIDKCESKQLVKISPNDEEKNENLEAPLIMKMKVAKKAPTVLIKDDLDKINGSVESIDTSKSVVIDEVSDIDNKMIISKGDLTMERKPSTSFKSGTSSLSCESRSADTKSYLSITIDRQDGKSGKEHEIYLENSTIIDTPEQSKVVSESYNQEIALNSDAVSESDNQEIALNSDAVYTMETMLRVCSPQPSTLDEATEETVNFSKSMKLINSDIKNTSVIDAASLKALDNSISVSGSLLKHDLEEYIPPSKITEEITPLNTFSTATREAISAETLKGSPLTSHSTFGIVPNELSTSLNKTNTSNLNTTTTLAVEGASIDSTFTGSIPSSIVETTCHPAESDISASSSSKVVIENSKSFKSKQNSETISVELNAGNNAGIFSVEKVVGVDTIGKCVNYVASTVSTMSVDSYIESDINEVTSFDEIKSTVPSTDTASDSSALIFVGGTNSQEPNLPMDAEPSDQPLYEEEIYQSQDLVLDEESYSQEQSFDSYEEQEEDTLESALIKAAVDAEHTRREINAKKQKEKENEQAKLREQAELVRKQREKSRMEAKRVRKLLEDEEQRERDILNRQIEERQKLEEEKRLAEERIQEESILTEEKIVDDERNLIKKKKLAEETKNAKKIETEMATIVESPYEIHPTETEFDANIGVRNQTYQETKILKPLNIEVEEQCDPSNTMGGMTRTTKDENNSEQRSESEDDNKPEYSSKMSQESLKMIITKHKTDELDTILKVYDPNEEELTIRKLKIKPVVEENVKITFKNLHEKIPHSPKRSLRNISPNRPQSPKVTIKPIKQESPLKITIKSLARKSDEIDPTQQISPKITIKPILNHDEDSFVGGKVKIFQKEEEDERLHSPKAYKTDAERACSPKVTIKTVVKPDVNESIPKLNIRLNKREQSPKHSIKITKNRDEENLVEPLKLNIKQFIKDPSSISPKITFKPVVRPQEPVHEMDEDHATQERIVLKINKSNYQVDNPQMRKREASEDIEKLAKIKLKVSKKPGHAHIVNEQMEALKRSLPEGIELVDIKKAKPNIPTHTQGGATITPIVMNEPTAHQDDLSSDSVIFVGEGDSAIPGRNELIVTPIKLSSSQVLTPVTTPPPKRRGRPRKVPLEPRDIPIEEPPLVTTNDNLLMITPNPNMSLLEGGHFLLSPTGSVSGGVSPRSEIAEQIISSGRPKRSCRGPNAHTQLGIKPRKPRGAGRARGGRGRGHRGGLRGGGVDKPGKFERIPEPKLKLLKESALSMKITDAFDRQDIAIRIVDGIREQCGIPTSGRRRGGGGHGDNSDDDDDGGTVISGGGGLEIIPRYGIMEDDEPMEMGRIGFLASGVIDITADDSLPPPEDEDDDDEMTVVEELASSSSPSHPCSIDRQLKIVIGRNDQIGHELIMTKDIVIYEEETRMSADNGSRSGTPGKQVSPAVDPLEGIIDMAMPCEDTQSSMQSSGTTESVKIGGGADVSSIKTTRRTICRSDLSQDIDALVAITLPEQLAEYHWQGDGPFMLQEQIAEYLSVKSFKRKYPNINRRAVDMQERDYIRDNGLASEAMCNLGLTVVNSADVLDIMYSDFQVKYEEYCKHRRDKEAKEIMNKQRAINLAASQEKTKQDLVQTAITSAAHWNARLNRTRREQRPACMDLQTFTINYAKGSRKVITRGRVGHYPLALVPGQFTDYYQTYTSTEIRNLPFNTILHTPISQTRDGDDSGSESDSSGGSDSGTESSSGSSGTSSSTSSDEDDKEQILPLHTRSPVAAVSGKRLLAVA